MKVSNKQSGAALFVSLILLLVLTILGLASMNDSVMQGKMAGAVQDSNIALQGVEATLREAESFIETGVASTAAFDDTGGLYAMNSTTVPDPFSTSDWANGAKVKSATKVSGLSEAPKYFIQHVGKVAAPDEKTKLNIETYSHESGAGEIVGFKIIARSTGASGVSQRIVESYYGKRF
ncbi:conserved hypothetical protein [Hahella chejuensis KCTC 2396]|uniref:Tfp pilus assembly protein PilX n=1 Tax=Hahella chejuensis (strain KCTC 2396) TaxID=349521 RepID=Q2S9U5_HAHCH|nr:pilus assembly protein [Hahella chejuensis]ABC32579.1 conserved hypothetical protein [Hahella chejuensis KCTC 2396]